MQNELDTALRAVENACIIAQNVAERLISTMAADKSDKSPVTVADFAVQAYISHILSRAFPMDPVVGEEDAEMLLEPENLKMKNQVVSFIQEVDSSISENQAIKALDRCNYPGGSGRFWTLDPIDGTKGFLRKQQYAIALALIENGEVVLGVLGCPNLPVDFHDDSSPKGTIAYAVKGRGAYQKTVGSQEFAKISVDEVDSPAEAIMCQSYEPGHTAKDNAALINKSLGVYKSPVEIDSQAKYALIARGDASVYLRLPRKNEDGEIIVYKEKIWDHAAGVIVVEEAGGKVTDIYGEKLQFNLGSTLDENTGVISTNGKIHAQVIEAVQAVY